MKKIWAIGVIIAFLCTSFIPKANPETKDTDEFMIYLKVKVLDELGDPVHGAEVEVYENKADFDNNVNPLGTKYTNKKGKARFSGLHKREYYVHALKDGKTNEEGHVKTDELHNVSFNKETVVIY